MRTTTAAVRPSLDPIKHPTIGQMMKDAGYRTACFGKWNVSNLNRRRANDFGFDRWVGLHLNHNFYTHKVVRTGELDMYEDGKPLNREGVWSDTIFADEAIRFIKAESDKPFFIYLPFQAPHDPIQDPDIPFDQPRDKKKPENRATLIEMIERLDLEIGRLLEALYNLNDDIAEQKNLAESHGEKLRAMSNLLDEWEAEMSKTAIPFAPVSRERKSMNTGRKTTP